MNYIETIKAKKDSSQQKAESKNTLDSLIGQLKEVQLATLMGNSKSTVVLADSTDFGDKMAELGDKITKVMQEFRDDTKNADKLAKIAEDYKNLSTYHVKSNKEQSQSIQKSLDNMAKSLDNIKMPKLPKIEIPKIPAPIVNIPKIDVDPIARAISELRDDKLDLDCYKAHDILNSGNKQYIGFLNPEAKWYIIENDTDKNTIRYVFGSSGYEKSFKQAPTYQYELLSEAVNAL